MNERLLEMRIGVVIWDIIENEIDKRCPEVLDMSPQERENIYGSCVRGVAEMILEDTVERTQEVVDELQREYSWGAYTLDDEEKKFASLRPEQNIGNINLEEALNLFLLPKALGTYKGEEVEVDLKLVGKFITYFVMIHEKDWLQDEFKNV